MELPSFSFSLSHLLDKSAIRHIRGTSRGPPLLNLSLLYWTRGRRASFYRGASRCLSHRGTLSEERTHRGATTDRINGIFSIIPSILLSCPNLRFSSAMLPARKSGITAHRARTQSGDWMEVRAGVPASTQERETSRPAAARWRVRAYSPSFSCWVHWGIEPPARVPRGLPAGAPGRAHAASQRRPPSVMLPG